MASAIIRYQRDKYVAVLTIAEVCNSLENIRALADELSELRIRIMSDEETRVIVLTNFGHSEFTMGEVLLSEGVGLETINGSWEIAEQIAGIDRLVISGITGNAIGIGLELALACDIRIASNTSLFGMPHVRERLIPWYGGTQRLSRLVGRAKAIEMILTGEMIDAKEAHRIGLVHKVVANSELMYIAMNTAQEIATKGPISLRFAKEAIHKGMDLTLKQGLRLEAGLYFLLHTTKDRTEGIRAFQEKRKAHFEGR